MHRYIKKQLSEWTQHQVKLSGYMVHMLNGKDCLVKYASYILKSLLLQTCFHHMRGFLLQQSQSLQLSILQLASLLSPHPFCIFPSLQVFAFHNPAQFSYYMSKYKPYSGPFNQKLPGSVFSGLMNVQFSLYFSYCPHHNLKCIPTS